MDNKHIKLQIFSGGIPPDPRRCAKNVYMSTLSTELKSWMKPWMSIQSSIVVAALNVEGYSIKLALLWSLNDHNTGQGKLLTWK